MAIDVHPVRAHELAAVTALQVALFREDAGTHDPSTDQTWPIEHGLADITDLAARDDAVVLVAAEDETAVGFLAGYTAAGSPTRLTSTYAVLRSLYVDPSSRRSGAASALVDTFVEWARARGCEEVVVDHYAANEGAARLYADLGFEAQSVSRVRRLADG